MRQVRVGGLRRVVLCALLAALVPACRAPMTPPPPPITVHDPEPPADQGRLVALLINGGGRREVNYQSHLQHIRGVIALLKEAGVAPGDIAIFSADGSDPAADLATRAAAPDDEYWLLPHSGAGGLLRPPIAYIDSSVDGFPLRPARKSELQQWFTDIGPQLGDGDTLLLYVTDHGEKNGKNLADNTITLWGESLSVTELRALLALVDPRARVVMVMSQCFSGSFAHAIGAGDEGLLGTGDICGFFASTADRPAYGCYPENRGKDGVGHSHHLLEALAALGRLPEAHRRVLVTDDSPDVPNATSDFFLTQLLQRRADGSRRRFEEVADELIAQAWEHRGDWEPDIRLLDRIGRRFGFFSPRSLAELERQATVLPEVSKQLRTYAQRWEEALEALALENLKRFTEAHPEWRERLEPKRLQALDAEARRQTAQALLAELAPYAERDGARFERLLSLRQRARDASQAAYRMEVRLGVVLRMRALLTSIAGREYLTRHGTPAERSTYARLAACENLRLLAPRSEVMAAELPAPPSFPPIAEDQRLVEAVMPAWMGIRYRPLQDAERAEMGAPAGAVVVLTVYPESPAEHAGMQVADVVLGPPGNPFEEPNQVREWTMRREIGEPATLQVRREAETFDVALRPAPYPIKLPELPGPPQVGSAAPPLQVELVRGTTQLGAHKPRLLFFWATWCLACKSALPEVLAFSAARGIEVLAITDEPRENLDRFLRDFPEPFPEIVATDRYRRTFQSYGVSGTPTFVLVDDAGTVRHYRAGYNPRQGLGIEGWQWTPNTNRVSADSAPSTTSQ